MTSAGSIPPGVRPDATERYVGPATHPPPRHSLAGLAATLCVAGALGLEAAWPSTDTAGSRVLSIVALTVAGLLGARAEGLRPRAAAWFAPLIVALTVPSGVESIAAMATAILPLWVVAGASDIRSRGARLAFAAIGALAWSRALRAPEVYGRLQELAGGLLPGSAPGIEIVLHPFAVLALLIGLWGLTGLRERRRAVALLVATLLLAAARCAMHAPQVDLLAHLACLAAWAAFGADVSASTVVRARFAALPAAAGALVLLGLPATIAPDALQGNIGFRVADGVRLEPPAADDLDTGAIEFGAWCTLLESRGARTVRVDGRLDETALANLDLLVLINHAAPLDDVERESIHSFVERGGRLLVLADHTDVGDQIQPTNELLHPYGIALRFDSALPFDRRWEWDGSLLAMRHPVVCRDDPPSNWGWRVGCSLDLRAPARPILVGTGGSFSDAGDRGSGDPSRLGDLTRSPDERIGGNVLIAEANSGRGGVLVCGDTSSFQDAVLPRTYPFVLRLSSFLLADGPKPVGDTRAWWLALGGLAVAGFGLLRALGGVTFSLGTSVAILGLGALTPARDDCARRFLDALPPACVVIDAHHGNAFESPGDEERGIHGLQRALMRLGRIPLQTTASLVEACRSSPELVIVHSPRTRFGHDELAAVSEYLHQGGTVWLIGGRREYDCAPEIWQSFGGRIGDEPLGADRGSRWQPTGMDVDLRDAWPVHLPDSEVLVEAWGRPVAAQRAVGAGRLVVLGDPGLFLGSSLEHAEEINEVNRELLAQLVSRATVEPR